ncbi:transposase [Rhodococcus sp. NPDC055112]
MPSVATSGRADLADAQWARLAPLLPRGKKAVRPPKWTKRQIIDGIRWRIRTGTPWRDVPARYGLWQTVYGRGGTLFCEIEYRGLPEYGDRPFTIAVDARFDRNLSAQVKIVLSATVPPSADSMRMPCGDQLRRVFEALRQ